MLTRDQIQTRLEGLLQEAFEGVETNVQLKDVTMEIIQSCTVVIASLLTNLSKPGCLGAAVDYACGNLVEIAVRMNADNARQRARPR